MFGRRGMNRQRNGILYATLAKQSRAVASGMPATSNKTIPGLITAAQYSGSPLPLPMRVSAGMAVTDLCGNTRMYSRPSPRTECVAVIRPASIASALSQPPSTACKPNSPNVTVLPREALPFTLPRWLFLNFTRLGMRGIGILLGGQVVPVIDPYLDAGMPLGGLGLGKPVIDL